MLKNKEECFISNIDWHLSDLKVPGAKDYSIESAIVVKHPMFWPIVAPDPLPILDDLEFYKRLRLGRHFLTEPIQAI